VKERHRGTKAEGEKQKSEIREQIIFSVIPVKVYPPEAGEPASGGAIGDQDRNPIWTGACHSRESGNPVL
jgi:hypothetical protein